MRFRSRALVWFHPPVELDGALDPRSEIRNHDKAELQVAQLTDKFEAVLDEVVHATDDWETHFLMHRLRKLVRSQRAKLAGAKSKRPDITEKTLGFARIRQGYYQLLAEKPGEVMALRKRVENYDADLRELKLDDHHLDQDPRLVSLLGWPRACASSGICFLTPAACLIFGYLANGPTALALWGLAKVSAKQKKDEATIKILAGAIAFPMTWMLAAFFRFFRAPICSFVFPWNSEFSPYWWHPRRHPCRSRRHGSTSISSPQQTNHSSIKSVSLEGDDEQPSLI